MHLKKSLPGFTISKNGVWKTFESQTDQTESRMLNTGDSQHN